MNGLHEIQRHFTGVMLHDSGQAQASASIKANGLKPEQRLSIYRNNTQLGLTEALRDGYPVVDRLVGTEFFNHLASRYIHRYPPTSGCLLSFGGQFAEFIASFQPAEALPYLPDTARLEWLWHEAFHEADGTGLDVSTLANVDSNLYGELGFVLHPTARFLASNYPVLRIWQFNQADHPSDERIHLNEGRCRLLIFRPGLEVEIIPLNDTEYLFLTSLGSGLSLHQSVEQVLRKEPAFDIPASLLHWAASGLFTHFSIA